MVIRFAIWRLLVLIALSTWAKDDLAQWRSVAAEYLGLSLETKDFDVVTSQASAQLLAVIAQRQPELYAQKAERLNELVTAAIERNIRDAMIGLDEDMAQVFSLEELTAARLF
jgi:hypothetical protein